MKINGGNGDDVIKGSKSDDKIYGKGGMDHLKHLKTIPKVILMLSSKHLYKQESHQ